MTKIPRRMRTGPNGPFLWIAPGLFLVLLGIYAIYLNGVGGEVILWTLAGFGMIGWGVYLNHLNKEDDW
ncbi:MAG TPA: hypothetical protein VJN71_06605 [Nitrososphaerales archaeon]|nr:hypothetical protein [Nitrososphaerales archaeon]